MSKQKLRVVELFSGIGAQKRGIDNTGLFDLEIVATSDVDQNAVVEYASIHHGLTNEMIEEYDKYPSREEMAKYLTDRNIGMDFDKDKMVDWGKYIKKKNKELEKYYLAAILGKNLGDISRIDYLPDADCWFYSSPCQSFSIAGRQDGVMATCNKCGCKYNPMDLDLEHRYNCPECGSDDIKGTRSGLLLEVERLLVKSIEIGNSPNYLFLENVKNLVSKKFLPDFTAWINRLDSLGYNSYWKVLNAKECGVPQNRERVFVFSVKKDIDNGTFTFPIPFDNGIRLKDILEKEVDEKYYINTDRASNLIKQLIDKGQLTGQRDCADSTINNPNTKDISNCITARYDASIQNKPSIGLVVAEPQQNRLGGMFDDDTKHQAGKDGICTTLVSAMGQGGGYVPMVTEKSNQYIWRQLGSTSYYVRNDGMIVEKLSKNILEHFEKNGEAYVSIESNGISKNVPVNSILKKVFGDTYKPIMVGNTTPSGKSQCNAVYSSEGVSQTLCAGTHGYATGNILEEKQTINIKQATKEGYVECEIPGLADLSFPNSETRRGRVQGGGQIAPTLMTGESGLRYIESLYKIRKLTPRECFKLMGFEFEGWDKCSAIGISNSAGYKAAGNSIVTNCIQLLFEHLYKAYYDSTYICTDEKILNFSKPQTE